MRLIFTVAVALSAMIAATASLALPSVEGTTRIVIAAGYSKHAIEVINAKEMRELGKEFEKLNTKTWGEESIIKFGGDCMVRVHFINQDRHSFILYAYPDRLYWSPEGRKNPYKYLAIGQNELSAFREKASVLLNGKRCAW